jgi:formylglycine-generating enzyme required for sulfatase activity
MKRRILLVFLVFFTLSCSPLEDVIEEKEPAPTSPPAEPDDKTPAPAQATTIPLDEENTFERPVDGMTMILIPAGEFLMGDDTAPFAYEKPQHTVTLDSYWIDRAEVTNAQYRLCVEAEACAEPKVWEDENLNGDDQPVLVPWEGAQAYCKWAGARLPSEAEWEKAARGTDGRKWPWGNEFDPSRANLSGDEDGYMLTAPVGIFPTGASAYGALDMAGNAAEWVADWYDAEYYAHSPAKNPTGPGSGDRKVYRGTVANGGSGPEKCRCTTRYPGDTNWQYGFRCAAITPPQ